MSGEARRGTATTQPAGIPATKAEARREFEEYQENPGSPESATPPTDMPGEGGDGPSRPILTLATYIRPLETIAIDHLDPHPDKPGEFIRRKMLYEMRFTLDYSVGRQSYLARVRASQLGLRMQEEQGYELDEEETATQRFYLETIVKAALPDLTEERRHTLSDEELETIAELFFDRSKELRERTSAATASPRTSAASSPNSNASTTATRQTGSASTTNSSRPTSKNSRS